MDINAELELENAEVEQLARILDCQPGDLGKRFAPFANAAIEEYARMLLGQRVFTRGSDLLEYRLLLLIQHAPGGRILDEHQVSAWFQRSGSTSRSLIRSVLAKYQYDLANHVSDTVKQELANVIRDGDRWSVTTKSENVIEVMNWVLGRLDGSLPQISRKPGTVSQFVLETSSYNALCKHYDITAQTKR